MTRGFAQQLDLVVASLNLFGLVSEGLLIGPSLFVDRTWGGRSIVTWECCSCCQRCCCQWQRDFRACLVG